MGHDERGTFRGNAGTGRGRGENTPQATDSITRHSTTKEASMADRSESLTVAVLGASPKKQRYSNQALTMLRDYGHKVIPIHPAITEIDGVATVPSLDTITEPVHTLTLYVGPARLENLTDAVLGLQAKRVIFNPGTELPELEARLAEAGVEVIRGCTLVMLRTGQF